MPKTKMIITISQAKKEQTRLYKIITECKNKIYDLDEFIKFKEREGKL